MLRSFFNVLLVLIGFAALAQSPVSVQQEASQFKKNLLEHHVGPRPIDDAFSKDAFDLFLKQLDPTAATIIYGLYVEQLSCQELAEMLDIPVGTVKSKAYTARTKLRNWLKEVKL